MKKKVIIGLSGGVDSSVAALLLKQQGYDVEGLFMRNWDSTANNDVLGNKDNLNEICPQEQDYLDAIEVAKKIGIKLHRVDFVKEYYDYVFQYFIDEYEKGRTPNPDILCNKYIKFDKFANYCFNELKADYIAMGHYAGTRLNPKTNEVELIRAVDDNKDQTYFLAQLSQEQIAKVLFPLQPYKKSEIRQMALDFGLITATKKDSTGICFIGEREFTKFLQNYIPNQPGKIIDITTNKELGSHVGVMYYTIGQRKGLDLGGQKEPYYVAKKDVANKIIYVAPASEEKYLLSKATLVNKVNWNVDLNHYFNDTTNFEITAKFRYRQDDEQVVLTRKAADSYLVEFKNHVKAVTEGQEAVFYLNDICLGGGTIDVVYH